MYEKPFLLEGPDVSSSCTSGNSDVQMEDEYGALLE